jgi:hypothetical protein
MKIMNSATLRRYVKEVILEALESQQKLRVFDFDDTLVRTAARIGVTSRDGEERWLTPGEYAVYEKQPGDQFDYSEFRKVIDPQKIKWTFDILNRVYSKYGPDGFVILTARAEGKPVEKFLEETGVTGVEVIALGNSDPRAKADWISDRIETEELKYVEFFDDSAKNVAAVKELQIRHPDVKIIARHV